MMSRTEFGDLPYYIFCRSPSASNATMFLAWTSPMQCAATGATRFSCLDMIARPG